VTNTTRNVCLYHKADHDGKCSAAIIKRMLRLRGETVELIPMNYGYDVPWAKCKGANVYVVDFSIQPFDDFIKLCKMSNVCWIDHHSTAIKLYDEYVKTCKATQPNRFYSVYVNEHLAACQLCWDSAYSMPYPRAVHLFGNYDTWNHEDPDVCNFEYGARGLDTDPDNDDFWNLVFTDNFFVSKICETGQSILAYEKRRNADIVASAAYTVQWEGYTWQVVNAKSGSLIFGDLPGPYITYYWARDKWCVSLYCDTEDDHSPHCGEIALKYGGGGHRGAAGFSCTVLPFQDVRLP
jgi:uncharacterized protein